MAATQAALLCVGRAALLLPLLRRAADTTISIVVARRAGGVRLGTAQRVATEPAPYLNCVLKAQAKAMAILLRQEFRG